MWDVEQTAQGRVSTTSMEHPLSARQGRLLPCAQSRNRAARSPQRRSSQSCGEQEGNAAWVRHPGRAQRGCPQPARCSALPKLPRLCTTTAVPTAAAPLLDFEQPRRTIAAPTHSAAASSSVRRGRWCPPPPPPDPHSWPPRRVAWTRPASSPPWHQTPPTWPPPRGPLQGPRGRGKGTERMSATVHHDRWGRRHRRAMLAWLPSSTTPAKPQGGAAPAPRPDVLASSAPSVTSL